jgi:hypothetical protein
LKIHRFSDFRNGRVALELLSSCRPYPLGRRTRRSSAVTQEIRELIDRILASYDEMDRRFTAAGGLGNLLSLYEQVRRELERVSFQELDRMTGEIKNVIEALLTIDYELRKVQNLKLVFDSRGGIGGQ